MHETLSLDFIKQAVSLSFVAFVREKRTEKSIMLSLFSNLKFWLEAINDMSRSYTADVSNSARFDSIF